jgi:hypothetical protein
MVTEFRFCVALCSGWHWEIVPYLIGGIAFFFLVFEVAVSTIKQHLWTSFEGVGGSTPYV